MDGDGRRWKAMEGEGRSMEGEGKCSAEGQWKAKAGSAALAHASRSAVSVRRHKPARERVCRGRSEGEVRVRGRAEGDSQWEIREGRFERGDSRGEIAESSTCN